MANITGKPIADQTLYRPPTQSQKPNMLLVSIPNFETPSAFVLTATKCFATSDGAPPSAKNHSFALCAFFMVSCVVKVLEAMMKRVVSWLTFFKTSHKSAPSTFATKWKFISSVTKGFNALITMRGPKSLPPIPIFTTSVIRFPVQPFHEPERTSLLNAANFAQTALISGITSLPSTSIAFPLMFLRAVCNTERPSVTLILSPPCCCAIASRTPASSSNSWNKAKVSEPKIFFEKSNNMPSHLILYLENRSGSSKKRVFKVRLSESKFFFNFFQAFNSVGFTFLSMMYCVVWLQKYHLSQDLARCFLSSSPD